MQYISVRQLLSEMKAAEKKDKQTYLHRSDAESVRQLKLSESRISAYDELEEYMSSTASYPVDQLSENILKYTIDHIVVDGGKVSDDHYCHIDVDIDVEGYVHVGHHR